MVLQPQVSTETPRRLISCSHGQLKVSNEEVDACDISCKEELDDFHDAGNFANNLSDDDENSGDEGCHDMEDLDEGGTEKNWLESVEGI